MGTSRYLIQYSQVYCSVELPKSAASDEVPAEEAFSNVLDQGHSRLVFLDRAFRIPQELASLCWA
eukprot:11160116-Lingulodinium_polyedra.AAC.1